MIATAFITFGLAVGIPYYNQSFFYDYFQRTFHWQLRQITLGFPLAALLTVWVGPFVVPLFSPRKLILVGTGLTAVAFFGFSAMNGSLALYYRGIPYTSRDVIVDVGPVKATAETRKTWRVPPVPRLIRKETKLERNLALAQGASAWIEFISGSKLSPHQLTPACRFDRPLRQK